MELTCWYIFSMADSSIAAVSVGIAVTELEPKAVELGSMAKDVAEALILALALMLSVLVALLESEVADADAEAEDNLHADADADADADGASNSRRRLDQE